VRLLAAIFLAGCAHAPTHWSYDHPERWEGTCSTGKHQSPIDFPLALYTPLGSRRPRVAESGIPIDWKQGSVAVTTTEHTVAFSAPPGSRLDGLELKQFHYHEPSEHTLSGQHVELELHFVHVDDRGRPAAVVAVLLIGVAEQAASIEPSYASIIRALKSGAKVIPDLDLMTILGSAAYVVSYDGSLTTPPCTEGIRWHVFYGTIGGMQLWQLNQVLPHHHNARPTQPLHDRRIVFSR
jgi:carbonic anhydrase